MVRSRQAERRTDPGRRDRPCGSERPDHAGPGDAGLCRPAGRPGSRRPPEPPAARRPFGERARRSRVPTGRGGPSVVPRDHAVPPRQVPRPPPPPGGRPTHRVGPRHGQAEAEEPAWARGLAPIRPLGPERERRGRLDRDGPRAAVAPPSRRWRPASRRPVPPADLGGAGRRPAGGSGGSGSDAVVRSPGRRPTRAAASSRARAPRSPACDLHTDRLDLAAGGRAGGAFAGDPRPAERDVGAARAGRCPAAPSAGASGTLPLGRVTRHGAGSAR